MAFAGAVSFGLLAILAKRRSAPSPRTLGDSLRMCKYNSDLQAYFTQSAHVPGIPHGRPRASPDRWTACSVVLDLNFGDVHDARPGTVRGVSY